jgi:hypothetical protein
LFCRFLSTVVCSGRWGKSQPLGLVCVGVSRFVWARRGLCRCFSFLEKIHVESCRFPSSPLLQQDAGVEKHTQRRVLERFVAFWRFGAVCGAVCGAVRCGSARCGAVRRGSARCGAFSTLNTVGSARCGAARFGAVRCGAARCGAVRYGVVQRGTACYDTEQKDEVRHGLVQFAAVQLSLASGWYELLLF